MSKETAMTTIESLYPVLVEGPQATLTAITQNLPGVTLSPWDLTRWRLAGATADDFVDADGARTDEIAGVIVAARAGSRTFFASPYKPGQTAPPDCFSDDGIHGIGTPGGLCLRCPHNQWGSAKDVGKASPSGRGKACTERILLFMVLRGSKGMPCMISVPPTALSAAKRYLINRLGDAGLATHQVETLITVNGGTMAFAMGERLTPENAAKFAAYSSALQAVISQLSPEELATVAGEGGSEAA